MKLWNDIGFARPSWAMWVVTKCSVCDGVFWASTLAAAESVVKAHGGAVWRLSW